MNPVMPDLAVRVPKGESADTFFSRFGTSQLQRRWELKACSSCSERGREQRGGGAHFSPLRLTDHFWMKFRPCRIQCSIDKPVRLRTYPTGRKRVRNNGHVMTETWKCRLPHLESSATFSEVLWIKRRKHALLSKVGSTSRCNRVTCEIPVV